MPTDKELMQQALEALESEHPEIQLRAAIALRERLAQPEQEPATKAGELRAMKEEFWKQPDRPMIPDDFPREGLVDD